MTFSPRHNRPLQRGAVAVAFILFSILLLGFVAFAMDVGRLYVSKSELQNAADSCALSASAALTGTNANQLQVAENYGITAGTRNLIGMQDEAAAISGADITFSATLNGDYRTRGSIAPEDAVNMRYARCTLAEPDISPLLMQVVNLLPGTKAGKNTVRASSVAGLGPSVSNCGIPLAVCTKNLTPPNFGYTQGEWLVGPFDTQDNITGKFKWVDIADADKTKSLRDYLTGAGYCNMSEIDTLVPTQGGLSTLNEGWNWRFGVRKNSGPPDGALPPDWTGFAYDATNWPSQFNVFDAGKANNFPAMQTAHQPWNAIPSNLKGNWRASPQSVHEAGMQGRRLVVSPFVDCSAWRELGNNNPQSILGWACVLMLNPVANPTQDVAGLEYRGPASEITSGCVTSGSPGGPGAGGPKVPTLMQ